MCGHVTCVCTKLSWRRVLSVHRLSPSHMFIVLLLFLRGEELLFDTSQVYVCQSMCLPVWRPVPLCVCACVCVCVCVCVRPSVRSSSVHLSVRPFVCLSICLSVCLSARPFCLKSRCPSYTDVYPLLPNFVFSISLFVLLPSFVCLKKQNFQVQKESKHESN